MEVSKCKDKLAGAHGKLHCCTAKGSDAQASACEETQGEAYSQKSSRHDTGATKAFNPSYRRQVADYWQATTDCSIRNRQQSNKSVEDGWQTRLAKYVLKADALYS